MLCRQRTITGTEISGVKYHSVTLQLVSSLRRMASEERERDSARGERVTERDSARGECDRQWEDSVEGEVVRV